jgi:hypothetical protein
LASANIPDSFKICSNIKPWQGLKNLLMSSYDGQVCYQVGGELLGPPDGLEVVSVAGGGAVWGRTIAL